MPSTQYPHLFQLSSFFLSTLPYSAEDIQPFMRKPALTPAFMPALIMRACHAHRDLICPASTKFATVHTDSPLTTRPSDLAPPKLKAPNKKIPNQSPNKAPHTPRYLNPYLDLPSRLMSSREVKPL